jgi:hypothetical protein
LFVLLFLKINNHNQAINQQNSPSPFSASGFFFYFSSICDKQKGEDYDKRDIDDLHLHLRSYYSFSEMPIAKE